MKKGGLREVKQFSQGQKMRPRIDPRSLESSHVLLPILRCEARGCRAQDHKRTLNGNKKAHDSRHGSVITWLCDPGWVRYLSDFNFFIHEMKILSALTSLWGNTIIMKTIAIKVLYKLQRSYKWFNNTKCYFTSAIKRWMSQYEILWTKYINLCQKYQEYRLVINTKTGEKNKT